MEPQKYQKFPLFGKESSRRGEPLDRFLRFLWPFTRLTILHQCFISYLICFTGNGVIADKPGVGQLGQIFLCTLQEKLCVESKNSCTFCDGHDELYHHAKFGGDRTMCTKNMVFVTMFFVCHALRSELGALFVRGEHSCQHVLRCRLLADFNKVCRVFSEGTPLSDALHSSHFRRQVAPQYSRNCQQKL